MAQGKFDLVIIGSGPAGYVAVVRAARLGKKVACVERAELGGICLNWGCIPTKALIQDAHLFAAMMQTATGYGLQVDRSKLQWNKIVARSRGVASTLSQGIEFLFKKHQVARFTGVGFVTPAGPASTFSVRVSVWMSMPRFANTIRSRVLISSSSTGKIRGIISTNVTAVPKAL